MPRRQKCLENVMEKRYAKGKTFSFKDGTYQKMTFKLYMKYRNYALKIPCFSFYQDSLTKETISNKKSTSKQKLVSCNSDESLLSPGPT